MNISILSVFPELYHTFLATSLVKRAQERNLVTFQLKSFFSYAAPNERIDAPTFGPGAGMLIKPEVIERAIADIEQQGKVFKIFFSPQGKKITQPILKQLYKRMQQADHTLLVASRYEGIDARVEHYYADDVLSIGDFVVMGGDLPAMLFLEGVLRYMPGVVAKAESVEKDSFSGPFLDYPEYTMPVEWKGMHVPEIIRSGNHAAIEQWRLEHSAKKSVLKRFDWVKESSMTVQERKTARTYIPPHYIALMHTDVLLPDGRTGTTSVTSFDIHDIARSAYTYGINHYFVVTPLLDQQKVVQTLLDFWQKGIGKEYNEHRYLAVNNVSLKTNFDEVMNTIEEIEGCKPVVIATSARSVDGIPTVSYFDQHSVWQGQRPIFFLFGTGKGLSSHLLAKADFVLLPLHGFTDFNHLSVRSAVAAILDRWLGINPRFFHEK